MTGGVRDTLAAAVRSFEPSEYRDSPSMMSRWRLAIAGAVLAALSSPEVVRVATEALVKHRVATAARDGDTWADACSCGWNAVGVNGTWATHVWVDVLVSALRGER